MNILAKNLLILTAITISTIGIKTGYAATAKPTSQPVEYQSFEELFGAAEKQEAKAASESKQATPMTVVTDTKKASTKDAKQASTVTRTLDTLVSANDLQCLSLSANNKFFHGETVAVIRSNGDLKYAHIFAPEQKDPEYAETHTDYTSPIKGYLHVICFSNEQGVNYKLYPIACIFKIDPETKEPAACHLCEKPFGQQNNKFYQCKDMFHASCVTQWTSETNQFFVCPICGFDRTPYQAPVAKEQPQKIHMAPPTSQQPPEEGPQ